MDHAFTCGNEYVHRRTGADGEHEYIHGLCHKKPACQSFIHRKLERTTKSGQYLLMCYDSVHRWMANTCKTGADAEKLLA